MIQTMAQTLQWRENKQPKKRKLFQFLDELQDAGYQIGDFHRKEIVEQLDITYITLRKWLKEYEEKQDK